MKKLPQFLILYYVFLIWCVPVLASNDTSSVAVERVTSSAVAAEGKTTSSVAAEGETTSSVAGAGEMSSSVAGNGEMSSSVATEAETSSVAAEREKKSVDDGGFNADNGNGYGNDDSMEIPSDNPDLSTTPKSPCGRRKNSKVHGIESATTSQFPFMAALLNQRYEYVCAGSVVATSMILTTAKCINGSLFYALVNSVSDKRDNSSIIMRVEHTEVFPTFSDGDSNRDVGIIYLEKSNETEYSRLQLANISDFSNIVDMEALGYGLNANTGNIKSLQHIGLEHRKQYDSAELKRGFFDCVDTKNVTCFRDFGGPVLANDELIGIVVEGQHDCLLEITSKYALNKLMAEVLPVYVFHPWVNEHLMRHADEETQLPAYPQPIRRSMPVITPKPTKLSSAAFKLPSGVNLNFAAFFTLFFL